MANNEDAQLTAIFSKDNEAAQCLTEVGTITQVFEEDTTMASSVGNERYLLDENSAVRDTGVMDEHISLIENQLQYLLSKADELQTQLLWSQDCLHNYGFVHIVPMFLQTCQPYFTYLESTARNSNPFHPPLSIYVRSKLLQFSQQLCSRLEHLVLLYASFNFFSLDESDPLSISHFYIGQFQIDDMKVSIFRYCCPTPFLDSTNTGLYKCMRWNVEREIEGEEEGKTYNSEEFYFLCCVDVIEATDDKDEDGTCKGENAEIERKSKVSRTWSVGRWIQTYPDPNTEDITDWVLCSVPCGRYKQMLCLGSEEPSSCTATDCLLGVLLSQETNGTFGIST